VKVSKNLPRNQKSGRSSTNNGNSYVINTSFDPPTEPLDEEKKLTLNADRFIRLEQLV